MKTNLRYHKKYIFCRFLFQFLYLLISAIPSMAFPHIQEVTVSDKQKAFQVIKVKGGKVSKGAGLASKIPGLEFLGTAKYIYGVMASIIGAIMFGAFKYVGSWENKKYLKEKEKERMLGRGINGSQGNRRIDDTGKIDGKRPLVEKPAPLFGSK